ncbi:MAG: heparinase II/III family protein [Lentisphaeria bacterium]|nr:heparinase II/III family protein [Lentisphaeria bacterium]
MNYEDQSAFRDEDFVKLINIPGLQRCKDISEQRTFIATHFRNRATPNWCFYMHGTAWPGEGDRQPVLDAADKLKQGIFANSWTPYQSIKLKKGNNIDWKKGAPLRFTIYRNTFVPELTTAFVQTGDSSYLKTCLELIKSYIAANPFTLDPMFYQDSDSYFGGLEHDTLAVCRRAFRWFDFLYTGVMQMPNMMSDEEVFYIFKHLSFYAIQYQRFVGDKMRVDNHHLIDHGYACFIFGTMLPELKFASKMQTYGKKTIGFHVDNNLFTDGSYAEHSLKYQYHITFSIMYPQLLAKENGIDLLDGKQIRCLSKWLSLFAHACEPNGRLLSIGDEQGGYINYLFETLAPAVEDDSITAMIQGLGYQARQTESFNGESLKRIAKRFKEGVPNHHGLGKPSKKVKAKLAPTYGIFPIGGFSFMRSAWTKGADYMGISHFSESIANGHTHWDLLSPQISCQGEALIADPSAYMYQQWRNFPDNEQRRRRGYNYAVEAHNTLVVNNNYLNNLEYLGHDCVWGGEPPRHALHNAKKSKFITAIDLSHDGFPEMRHRRIFAQVTGVGFITIDYMNEDGDNMIRPHEYTQLLHADFDVAVEQLGPLTQFQLSKKQANLCVVPGPGSECQVSQRPDKMLEGMTLKSGKVKRGPELIEISRRHRGKAVFSTFYITGTNKVSTAALKSLIPTTPFMHQHPGINAYEIRTKDKGKVLLLSAPFKQKLKLKDIETDARLALVYYSANGRVIDYLMLEGKTLIAPGIKLTHPRKQKAVSKY